MAVMQTARIPLPFGSKSNSPNRIIVHAMGEFIDDGTGRIYSALDWLKYLRLSSHSLITPSGVIIRTRNDNEGAYHAKGYNKNSLGIEFLVPGVHTWQTFRNVINNDYLFAEQYQAGVDQVMEWMDKYNITSIERHSDVSPVRKNDPGNGFPWTQFLHDIGVGDD